MSFIEIMCICTLGLIILQAVVTFVVIQRLKAKIGEVRTKAWNTFLDRQQLANLLVQRRHYKPDKEALTAHDQDLANGLRRALVALCHLNDTILKAHRDKLESERLATIGAGAANGPDQQKSTQYVAAFQSLDAIKPALDQLDRIFCPTVQPPPLPPTCPGCGAHAKPNDHHCGVCGAKLR